MARPRNDPTEPAAFSRNLPQTDNKRSASPLVVIPRIYFLRITGVR
jgi:hypothetical protein